MSCRSVNKLNRYIKVLKDLLTGQKKNVVYRLDCENCNAAYVRKTKRKLTTRISENRSQINRNVDNISVVTEHRLDIGHNFNWQNTKILNTEQHFHKRSISEMIQIKLQDNQCDFIVDTEKLKPYFSVLEAYKLKLQ